MWAGGLRVVDAVVPRCLGDHGVVHLAAAGQRRKRGYRDRLCVNKEVSPRRRPSVREAEAVRAEGDQLDRYPGTDEVR